MAELAFNKKEQLVVLHGLGREQELKGCNIRLGGGSIVYHESIHEEMGWSSSWKHLE